jgi:hypothetical protein
MSLEKQVLDLSYAANGVIGQYRAVRLVAEGIVALPAAAKGACIGVTQEAAAASGDIIRVRRLGISKVKVGGSATIASVASVWDTAGLVGQANPGLASGDTVLGIFEDVPSASGDIAAVWVSPRILY